MNLIRLKDFFENNGVKSVTEFKSEPGTIDWELIVVSKLGEENCFLLTCDATLDAVENRLYDVWYEFDEEEHANEIFENQKNGYYDGAKGYELAGKEELLQDAEDVKDTLSVLVDAFRNNAYLFAENNERCQ